MMRVLVVGELNVDLVMTGLPALPIIGRELLGTGLSVVLGSSSAITAARLAALGAETGLQVDFVGVLGDDDFGQVVLRELARFGVGTTLIERIPMNTGVTIALTYAHDRALLTYPGAMTQYTGANLTPALLSGYQHLHVGSFFLQTGLQAALPTIFQSARQHGLTTSLDVGWDPLEQWHANPHLAPTLAHTDYFFPNEAETAALTGTGNITIEQLAGALQAWLLVKRGGEGAAAYNPQGNAFTMPSFPVAVVDTTGAGDAFNAGFIYAHRVEGKQLDDALRFAVACGAQAVTQIGGATGAPSAAEIRHFMG